MARFLSSTRFIVRVTEEKGLLTIMVLNRLCTYTSIQCNPDVMPDSARNIDTVQFQSSYRIFEYSLLFLEIIFHVHLNRTSVYLSGIISIHYNL